MNIYQIALQFVILSIFTGLLSATVGGYLYFQFICYKNPIHLDYRGNNCDSFPSRDCDPYFDICISNLRVSGASVSPAECPILYLRSSTYDNWDRVCNIPNDNRNDLSTIYQRPLGYPLQEVYYLKIVVTDDDKISSHSLIGTFYSDIKITPSYNSEDLKFMRVSMIREEANFKNPQASLVISVAIACEKDYYGPYCLTRCLPKSSDPYTCAHNGSRICNEGWKGVMCDEPDLCLYQACIKDAKCIEVNGEAKCLCNGVIGPQCYPDYNPCDTFTCYNNASCIPPHDKPIKCLCPHPYTGTQCQDILDYCDILAPCVNNATCTNQPYQFTRMCNCDTLWTGDTCNLPIPLTQFTTTTLNSSDTHTNNNILSDSTNKIVILSILVGVLLILLLSIVLYQCICRKSKTLNDNYPQISMMQLYNKTQSSKQGSECQGRSTVYTYAGSSKDQNTDYEIVQDDTIPNRYDSDTCYEEVNDSPLNTDYDGYMLPTVTAIPLNSDSSSQNGYLVLQNNDSENRQSSSCDTLPPLPSRNKIHKKSSFKKIFFPQ